VRKATWLDHLAGKASQQVGYSGLGGGARKLARLLRAVLLAQAGKHAGEAG